MQEYIVYRVGWNDANQCREHGLPEKMAVARLEASRPGEACRQAREQVVVCANQHLTAEPAQEVDAREELLNQAPGPWPES